MFKVEVMKAGKVVLDRVTDFDGAECFMMWFIECHQAGDGYQMTVSYNGQVITSAA